MNLPTTLLEKLQRLPPIVCRLLARTGGRAKSDEEIRKETGWSKNKLSRITCSSSWKDISVGDVDTYLSACGLSWSSQRRARWLIQRNGNDISKMQHLRTKGLSGPMVHMINLHLKRAEKVLMTNE